jgi:hypothetical protein
MRSIQVVASLVIAGALAGSCSSGQQAPNCQLVATPGGLAPSACVHEVPNGASVTTDAAGASTVTLNGIVVATYPPCPCTTDAKSSSPGADQ